MFRKYLVKKFVQKHRNNTLGQVLPSDLSIPFRDKNLGSEEQSLIIERNHYYKDILGAMD